MRKIGKTLLSLGLAVSMAFSGQYISGVTDGSNCVNAATKVKINKKTASIYVGKTVQLKITGTKKKVSWKSSNKKVATVTTKGKVKGIKKGTAKITATVSKKKYTCKVTVKKKTTNNTSETSKPTSSTKPSTTNKPAISDTIISNFSSLKVYIAKYGQTNSSGNKFIKTSLTNNSFGIVYDATNSKYTFIVSGTTSNGKTDYALSMDVKETYLGDGDIGCAIIYTNGLCANLDTNSSLQDINGKSELNWTVTDSTGGDNASWISIANTVLNIGYVGWDLLVYETLNLNIKDFGFGGDTQTSVATPTNAPIVTATPMVTPTVVPTTTPIVTPTVKPTATVTPTETPDPMLPNFDAKITNAGYFSGFVDTICVEVTNKGDEDIIFGDGETGRVTYESYTGKLKGSKDGQVVTTCAITANTKGYFYVSLPNKVYVRSGYSRIYITFYYKGEEYSASITTDRVSYYKRAS